MADQTAPFVLAIDVGSSSVRASLYDAQARPLEDTAVREATELTITPDGGVETSSEELAQRVERTVDGALARAGARSADIAAVALDAMAYTMCGLDGELRPITPFYLYAEGRSAEDASALRRELDFTAVYQRTGCPLHTSYLPARLRWLRRTRPDLVRRARLWVDVATYLYGRWFARADVPASFSMSSWSGLLDREHLWWDRDLLRHLDVAEESLPPLADYDHPLRGLAPPFAARWPALRDRPFYLGVGDGAAANVGSGCVSPQRLALTVGTTGALRLVVTDRVPKVRPGLWAYTVGATETLLGGALSEGGNVLAWARSALALPTAGLDAALSALTPDGHGLTVLPLLAGERSPGWSSHARSVIEGITPATSALQILQACLEAVCYRFALVARLLRPSLGTPCEIVASGGALSTSPFWMQLMSDVLQHPLLVSREGELTSRGTAILVLKALGAWRTLEDVPLRPEERVEPDASRAAVYQAALERQHRLYERLVDPDPVIGPVLRAVVREG